MSELVFFLEEPSAQAMLEGLLPRLLPEITKVRYVVFEGKQDLEKQILRRLRGYRSPGSKFVILRDQDSADCQLVKAGLTQKCREAGRSDTLVRIACHELESWYLGDLAAVETALQIRGLSASQNGAKYRRPDGVARAAEELSKLTKGVYQKILGSRAIGPLLDPENTRSHSFKVFITGLQTLVLPRN